jgi:GDP-L-fucose synthase
MSYWLSRRVLVTGGSGFVGSHLVERLVEAGADVRATGRRDRGSWHPVPAIRSSVDYRQGDLADPQFSAHSSEGRDIVLHLAAVVGGIGFNAPHPALLFSENVIPGVQLLRAAQAAGAERILLTSSACVYPRDARIPTPEEDGFRDDPEQGNIGYGWGKRSLEVFGRMIALEHGTSVAIARAYNAFGPRDDFSPATSHVIPALLRKALTPGDELHVWGDGTPTRSFVFVDDIVRGLLVSAERGPVADPVNLGTREEVSVADLTRMVMDACGVQKRIVFDPTKPGGQPRRTCDVAKAERLIGWKAEVPLREGLARTVAWLRENPQVLEGAAA